MVDRGFVTYSNEAKMEMLGVSAATLDAHGAVSRETALEMAAGALAHSRAGIALSVTGIAGPDGGSAEKPVGLVWFGLAHDRPASRSPRSGCSTNQRPRLHPPRDGAGTALEMGLTALERLGSAGTAVDRVGALLEGVGEHAEGAVEHRAHQRAEDAALELVVDEEMHVASRRRRRLEAPVVGRGSGTARRDISRR